jgi:beta-xylosidase
LGAFADGDVFKEITPKGYVEGSFMIKRKQKYYFMWSEGDWTDSSYCVAYAVSDSPLGPFERLGKILQSDPAVATGAGHQSVFQLPGSDEWFIVYHRRAPGEKDFNNRVTCMDRMIFEEDGRIRPEKMT